MDMSNVGRRTGCGLLAKCYCGKADVLLLGEGSVGTCIGNFTHVCVSCMSSDLARSLGLEKVMEFTQLAGWV